VLSLIELVSGPTKIAAANCWRWPREKNTEMNREPRRAKLLVDPASLPEQASCSTTPGSYGKREQPGPTMCSNGSQIGPWAYLKRSLFGKDSLAILDQCVVSCTRFLTSLIVGRACGPHELGEYQLGFTLYCLGACVQTGLISLPFTIYGNYLQDDERRA